MDQLKNLASSCSRPHNSHLCLICEKSGSKYICPRCGIGYCSLVCYQHESHLNCSESFYKECIEEQIQNDENNGEKVQKMKEILQRFHQNSTINNEQNEDQESSSLDSDDDEDLAKRVENVNLDDPDEIWGVLTNYEKAEFKKLVQSPDEYFPIWNPWWREVPNLVQEHNEDNKCKILQNQPDLFEPIPKFTSLSKCGPDSSMKYNVANVVSAYVVTCRFYNGDFSNSEILSSALLTLSPFLSQNIKAQIFKNFQKAITNITQISQSISENFGASCGSLQEDVFIILTGGHKNPQISHLTSSNFSKFYTLSALSHIYSILQSALKNKSINSTKVNKKSAKNSKNERIDESLEPNFSQLFPDEDGEIFEKRDKSEIKGALRKILYLLAFVNEFPIF